MTKRVFIIHGWGGYPQEGWFPWLKSELEKKGFEVAVPAMPDAGAPVIEKWVGHLAKEVGTPDSDTYLVGHSIGGNTVLRYLETVAIPVGGAVCVAGALILSDTDSPEDQAVGKPWVETPIDFEKIKRNCPVVVAIYSTNEDVIPLEENKRIFEQKLGAKIIMEPSGGHFGGDSGITKLPSLLEALESMGA